MSLLRRWETWAAISSEFWHGTQRVNERTKPSDREIKRQTEQIKRERERTKEKVELNLINDA